MPRQRKNTRQIAAYEYEQEIRKLTEELVGLYDALERRPAVQVAKTIKQRAEEYIANCGTVPVNRMGRFQGYIKGATEQLKADKEKVYHALEKIASKEVLEELIKIMEE